MENEAMNYSEIVELGFRNLKARSLGNSDLTDFEVLGEDGARESAQVSLH